MKKKVIFIHQNLVVGGAEELRLTILKYLDRNKFDITVCSIENNGLIAEEIKKIGIPVINLNRKCNLWDIRITFDLYGLIKKGRYDIVQTSLFYANLHGRIAAYMARAPIIISEEHNIYAWKDNHPSFILMDRILSRITRKIITCSDSVKRFTSKQERIPVDKFLTIHNCIDINKFSITKKKEQIREQHGFNKNEKIIIVVGTLCEQKGHRYLLQAFKEARKTVDGLKLLIIGDGPLAGELRAQAYSLNVEDSAIFMGTRRDIPELLNMADIFVLSSLWEGFGIVLLEAMASGLAVLATDVDGVPEVVINGKTGILVLPRDVKSLTNGIISLLSGEEKRLALGSEGRRRVLDNFTPRSYIDKLMSLYA